VLIMSALCRLQLKGCHDMAYPLWLAVATLPCSGRRWQCRTTLMLLSDRPRCSVVYQGNS